MKINRSRFLLLIIAVAALLLAACDQEENVSTIKGSGTLATETREVSDFDAVRVVGNGIATITVGETETLTIEAEDNILPVLTSEVENGTLILSTKTNTSMNPTRDIRYTITAKSLAALKVTGNATITASGITADQFAIDLSGSGQITASGTTEMLTVEFTGNGNVFAFELAADSASVGLAGNGRIELNVRTALDADLSGDGQVVYVGEPEVTSTVTGNGSVRPR